MEGVKKGKLELGYDVFLQEMLGKIIHLKILGCLASGSCNPFWQTAFKIEVLPI